MSFLVLFALSWTAFYLLIDFQRLRELYPAAVTAALLGSVTDLMMLQYRLWSYKSDVVSAMHIPLLLDSSIYPVAAALFAQHLPLRRPKLTWLLYIVVWSVPAILLEWWFMMRGEMHHFKWWTLWHSFFSDILIFTIITLCFLACRTYAGAGRSREVRP